MTGRFITIEGIDGAGKSTCSATLRQLLETQGRAVVVTREPGGTPVGEAIRALLLDPATRACTDTETLLMFAARAEHLHAVVRPALARGAWVLCDRFTDATYAYQGGGRGVPKERLDALREWVHADLTPDLTILLDADLDTAAERRARRGGDVDRFEQEAASFHARVRRAYLTLAQREPHRIRCLDARLSPEQQASHLSVMLLELERR